MRDQVKQLFDVVADLSDESRGGYFSAHSVGATTRGELEELLKFDVRTSVSLENNIARVAAWALSPLDGSQSICGPYRLGNLLGRGGMGSVYLAERVDGELSQRVAVKLLRYGMDDPQLRLRFLAERQILANLSHPNIARLLDAGHREDGQPYLVMEHIDGKALDVSCSRLSVRQKVALFIKVCGAVAYLHKNLVVHRDLKPANILVTPEGEPKLLDFGIAKILDLTSDPASTGFRMLTPEYASPEQATGRPVSTATDIYSLGALLYRLLTGQSPHQFGSNSAEEIVQAFSTGKNKTPSVAGLDTDLGFILLKSLRPEPEERYGTVEQLSEDLENYLASRSIRARRGDTFYHARKFLRRYWAFASAATLVGASLGTGLYVANRERLVAERRFGQLRQLSKRVIELDRNIRTLPGAIDARQRLVAASLEYLEGLAKETRGNPELAQEISEGYWRMARIQGVNAEFNLGLSGKAEESLKKADTLISTVLDARPDSRDALFRAALVSHDRMIVADTEARRSDALAHAHRAVNRLESVRRLKGSGEPVRLEGFLRGGNAEEAERSGVAQLYTNVALAFVNMHLYPEAARQAQNALDLARSVPSSGEVQSQILSILANALRYQGDVEGSLRSIREAKRIAENTKFPTDTSRFFTTYAVAQREAMVMGEAGAVSMEKPEEAIALFGRALDMAREATKRDPRDSASRSRLATTAREFGAVLRERDPKRALEVYDLGIQMLRETGDSPKTRRDTAELLANSSYPLRRLMRTREAESRMDTALSILKASGAYPSPKIRLGGEVWGIVSALADLQEETLGPARAIETYEQLLAGVAASKADVFEDLRAAPRMSQAYARLSALYKRVGNKAKAEDMDSQRINLWSSWSRTLPESAFVRHQLDAARQAQSKFSL